jgi:AmmeMemoRadiSam system protein B
MSSESFRGISCRLTIFFVGRDNIWEYFDANEALIHATRKQKAYVMDEEKKENEYPKLRPIEALPAQEGMVCLRDPEGFSDKLIFLPRDLFFIVILFDGQHSILDIQEAYTRRFGDLLFSEKVREIIDKLDSALFLDSSRFQSIKKRAVEEFREAATRPATHAGVAYEAEAEGLKKQLGELFEAPEGPGPPKTDAPTGSLRGLIAPHIDIRRGGVCFAHSYAELARESKATTFVILGIAHVPTARRFVLTAKDFDTPLGTVPCDRDFVETIGSICAIDFFEDEWTHRGEHSVEFQAVFLRYLYPEKKIRIVPVLCSSRDGDYLSGSHGKDPEFVEFTSALCKAASERGSELCYIASVDLAHLGRRFGQDLKVDSSLLAWAKGKDMEMIRHITDRDAEEFFQYIVSESDSRNVCGVPALYTMLKVMEANSAKLLFYDQAFEEQTDSAVTFMSAGFYEG